MKKTVELVVHGTNKKDGREIATETKLRDVRQLTVFIAPKGVLGGINSSTTVKDFKELPIGVFVVPITYDHTTGKVKIEEPWRSTLSARAPELKVNIVRKIEKYRFLLDEKLQKKHIEETVPTGNEQSEGKGRL